MKNLWFIDYNGKWYKIFEDIKLNEAYKIVESILNSHLGEGNYEIKINCEFITYGERTYFALL